MHHLVGQPLIQQGGELVLPQYSVGALQGIPVPEPQRARAAGGRHRAGRGPAAAKRLIVRRWLALALLVVCPLAARASDESDVLRARGALLAAEGNCAEAIPLFQRAIAADPQRGARGPAARPLPDRGQAVRRGGAHARRGGAARSAPARRRSSSSRSRATTRRTSRARAPRSTPAQPSLNGNARFQLYNGMLLLQEGKRSEGIAALERAREIDPKMVEPTASYVEGLALENEGERAQAREAMERVIVDRPERSVGHRGARAPGSVGVLARRDRDYWAARHGRLRVRQQRRAARPGRRRCRATSPTKRTGAAIWNANAGYEFLHTRGLGRGRGASTTPARTRTSSTSSTTTTWSAPAGSTAASTENLTRTCRATTRTAGSTATRWVSEVAGDAGARPTRWAPNSYTRVFGRFYWSNYYFDPDDSTAFIPPPGYDARTRAQPRRPRRAGRARAGRSDLPRSTRSSPATALLHALSRRGQRVLVPRHRRRSSRPRRCCRGSSRCAARQLHLPRLPEQHHVRDRSAGRSAAEQRQAARSDLRRRGRARATRSTGTGCSRPAAGTTPTPTRPCEVFDYDRIIYGAYFTVRSSLTPRGTACRTERFSDSSPSPSSRWPAPRAPTTPAARVIALQGSATADAANAGGRRLDRRRLR